MYSETTYNLVERLNKAMLQYEIPLNLIDLLEEAALRITTLESYLEGAEPTEHIKP